MFQSKLRNRKSHKQIQSGRKLFLEGLESRQLMAANLTATLNTADKILRVEGTNGDDSIIVRNQAGRVSVNGINIQVNNNGALSNASSVARSLITRVEVKSLSGHDIVTMNETGMTAGQGLPLFAWGGAGNDKLTGGSMADRLYGENGSDTLTGKGGNDQLVGAFLATDVETGGADKLIGNEGNDVLRGGGGHDNLNGGTGNDKLRGCDGNDTLTGGADVDDMDGGVGDDLLVATAGYATLTDTEFVTWFDSAYTTDAAIGFERANLTATDIGLGYTYLNAGSFSGSALLKGTSLPDYLYGGAANDQLLGLDGNDYLVGYGGDDTLDAGLGDDTIGGGIGSDNAIAGDGSDTFFASSGYGILSDTLYQYWNSTISDYISSAVSGFEKATLYAIDEGYGYALLNAQSFSGPVTLYGSALNDYLYGGDQADSVYGYGGNDYISTWGGVDYVYASDGVDTVYAGDGNDVVYGGTGNDALQGEAGSDVLYGEDGDDTIKGAYYNSAAESSTDYLYGGNGNDSIYGGWGNDYLYGSYGNDLLAGEDGADYCFGENDNDTVLGAYVGNSTESGGDDWLFGGWGDDNMSGGDGYDNMYGEDGNDQLIGHNGRDKMFGGWGNDAMWGGAGNDRLAGQQGDDQLVGDDGNDEIIGGAGVDKMWGAAGDDSLVAIDGGTSDQVIGNEGRDTMWVDANFSGWTPVFDTRYTDSLDTVQTVFGFANGADRSLDGDAIADPTDATNQKNFSNNWVFADWGPTMNDVDQQDIGDCWLMASMGAVAGDNPSQIREIVADFGDGTYGVKLGGSFYRVDADLSTWSASSTDQRFAGLGQQNALWVALIEKAYTMHTGSNTYASIDGGYSTNALSALGATSVNSKSFSSSTSDADVANEVFTHWNSYQNTVVDVFSPPAGSPLVGSHSYTVVSVSRDASGNVTSILLRNPWGGDDTSGNPYVSVTPAQLGACGTIRVAWGTIS